MEKPEQKLRQNKRNSSLELVKIIGIVFIVISHVVQSLCEGNSYMLSNDYLVDLSMATTSIQQLILSILRYGGVLGNSIFFISTAWFLLESDKVDTKKILHMLFDIWVISSLILIPVYIIRHGDIPIKLIIKQIMPITFDNNWYITCYILFYPVHPFLNWLIKKMGQKTLLKTTLIMLCVYVGVNYVLSGRLYSSTIILWITLYFAIAYMKYYLVDLSNNIKFNVLMCIIGIAGNIVIICLTNFVGLYFDAVDDWVLKWNSNCSPFMILAAVSIINIARNIPFENKVVNYISSLSLLIYITHENLLIRTLYRPLMWNYVYNHFGYDYILIWTFILAVIVFAFGLIASILYRHTIEKIVTIVCRWLHPILHNTYEKIENRILKLH